jgi:hypothetical protein
MGNNNSTNAANTGSMPNIFYPQTTTTTSVYPNSVYPKSAYPKSVSVKNSAANNYMHRSYAPTYVPTYTVPSYATTNYTVPATHQTLELSATSDAVDEVLAAFQQNNVAQLSPYSRQSNYTSVNNDPEMSQMDVIEFIVTGNDKMKSQLVGVQSNAPKHLCSTHCICERGVAVSRYNSMLGGAKNNTKTHGDGGDDMGSSSTEKQVNVNGTSSSTTQTSQTGKSTSDSNSSVSSESSDEPDYQQSRIYLTDVQTTDLYKYSGGIGDADMNVPYTDGEIDDALTRLERTRGLTKYTNNPSDDSTDSSNYLGLETPNQPAAESTSEDSLQDLRTVTPRGRKSVNRNKKSALMG